LLNRFGVFFNDIEWFLCDFIFFVFYALFIFFTLSVVMFQLSPLIFMIVLAFIPLHIINFRLHANRLRLVSGNYLSSQATLSSFTLQSIEGRDEIKSYFLHHVFAQRLGKIVDDMHTAMGSRQQHVYRQENLQGALVIVNHVAVIVVGSSQVIHGSIGLGTLFFFLLLLNSFYSPIYRFSSVNQSLQAACIKIEEMAKIIENPHRENMNSEIASPREVETLRLVDVQYNAILCGVDYTFRKGQIYFLIGESGSGKTTLLNLLTRFLVKDSGKVMLDEVDSDSLSEFDLRKCIVYGIQEKLLFNTSIIENIHLLGNHSVDMQKIEQSSYFAVADEFIDALPQKHRSKVYEYGSNFSGGQQQRLALTRVFYHDAPIMLFDEPTSALDIVTERLFYERLQQLKAHKIIIVVSHRPSTYRYADHILRLDQGKLYSIDVVDGRE
jgi:ABC-type bacteriocin/lantibiotic exporter with double-glycine peptidase domain